MNTGRVYGPAPRRSWARVCLACRARVPESRRGTARHNDGVCALFEVPPPKLDRSSVSNLCGRPPRVFCAESCDEESAHLALHWQAATARDTAKKNNRDYCWAGRALLEQTRTQSPSTKIGSRTFSPFCRLQKAGFSLSHWRKGNISSCMHES